MHFDTETVRVSNLLESHCALSKNSNKTETRKSSLDIGLKKDERDAYIDCSVFFYITQQEPRPEAMENNGTLFSLV